MPSANQRFTLTRQERLASRKIISELFENGNSTVCFPFRLVWKETVLPVTSPVQIAFSVPSKKFRLAVTRNRIKRQMREVYRKNKSAVYDLLAGRNKQCAMMLVFTGSVVLPFEEIEKKIKLTLLRFEEDFKKHAE
jgi:ribonuclease P protein component